MVPSSFLISKFMNYKKDSVTQWWARWHATFSAFSCSKASSDRRGITDWCQQINFTALGLHFVDGIACAIVQKYSYEYHILAAVSSPLVPTRWPQDNFQQWLTADVISWRILQDLQVYSEVIVSILCVPNKIMKKAQKIHLNRLCHYFIPVCSSKDFTAESMWPLSYELLMQATHIHAAYFSQESFYIH